MSKHAHNLNIVHNFLQGYGYEDSEEELEVDASSFSKSPNKSSMQKSRKGRNNNYNDDDDDDDGPSEKLLLSMKELRVSSIIRKKQFVYLQLTNPCLLDSCLM